MIVIGITGYAGAGKDALCTALQSHRHGIARAAFADALKIEVARAYGVDASLFHDPATKNIPTDRLAADRCSVRGFAAYLGSLAMLPELRPRTVMQQWGDFRRCCDPEYWTYQLEPVAARAREAGYVALIVTDVRYPNEAEWIWARGGVLWRVTRDSLPPPSTHSSEWSLAGTPVDLTIPNDGSLGTLEKRALDAFDLLAKARA